MQRLTNPVRHYTWGGTTVIPDLLGVPPDGRPQAELWLGAHPDSASALPDGTPLDEAIHGDPDRLLGAAARTAFGDRLPFLCKILSAAAPLSLQVHPGAAQAAAGHADEDARDVPDDAFERRYRDPFHKPEMVIALDRFEALCGLRHPERTRALVGDLDVAHPSWDGLLRRLEIDDPSTALREAVTWLLGGDACAPQLVEVVAAAARPLADRPELATVVALADAYPGDPGVLVALLLNRVTLAAREALYLPPGNLHAYISGTAFEVMAASDNVLRAGLTDKHVDPAELLRVLDTTPRPPPVVEPTRDGPAATYRADAAEFEVVLADLDDADPATWHEIGLTGPRILLVIAGYVRATTGGATGAGERHRLTRGASVFVAACEGPVRLCGAGTVVCTGTPATGHEV